MLESALQCADLMLILKLQGKVVGLVTILFPSFKTRLDVYRNVGHIHPVCEAFEWYVDLLCGPQWGPELLKVVESKAYAFGVRALRLYSIRSAMRFYNANGFRECDTFVSKGITKQSARKRRFYASEVKYNHHHRTYRMTKILRSQSIPLSRAISDSIT